MKHVERRHFFIREMVEERKIRCPFVSAVDNLADFETAQGERLLSHARSHHECVSRVPATGFDVTARPLL